MNKPVYKEGNLYTLKRRRALWDGTGMDSKLISYIDISECVLLLEVYNVTNETCKLLYRDKIGYIVYYQDTLEEIDVDEFKSRKPL